LTKGGSTRRGSWSSSTIGSASRPGRRRPSSFPCTDAKSIVHEYVRGWNAEDEASRRELIEATFAARGVYADPDGTIEGRDHLLADIAEFHERRPGARVELRSAIDEFGGWFRFAWAVVDPTGDVLRHGEDFGQVGDDGRITMIVGFFGPLVGDVLD
jgi:hypothetical protein